MEIIREYSAVLVFLLFTLIAFSILDCPTHPFLARLHTYRFQSITLFASQSAIKKVLDLGINQVGYKVKRDEGTVRLRNRMQILEFACKVGHNGCMLKMTELFNNLRQNGVE